MSSSLTRLLLLFLLFVIIINKKRAEERKQNARGTKRMWGLYKKERKRERTRLTWMTMPESSSSSSCISHSLLLLLMIRGKREEEEILLEGILGRLFVRLGFLSSSSSSNYKAHHHHLPPCLLLPAIAFREWERAWDSSYFFPDVRRPVESTAIDRERKKEKKAGVFVLVRSLCVFLPPGLARGVKRSLGFGNWGCGVVRFSSSIFVSSFFWVCLFGFFFFFPVLVVGICVYPIEQENPSWVREARRRTEKVLQADRRGMLLYNLLFWEKVVENQRRGGVCFRFLVTTSIGKGTKQNPKERKKHHQWCSSSGCFFHTFFAISTRSISFFVVVFFFAEYGNVHNLLRETQSSPSFCSRYCHRHKDFWVWVFL